jgi:hypothetical protein
VRVITIAISALIFSAIGPVSAKAKTDRSTSNCEKRCHEYNCFANPNQMYCRWACHQKCTQMSPDDRDEK